jgi:hypothetical protein
MHGTTCESTGSLPPSLILCELKKKMIRRRGIVRSFCHGNASTSTLQKLHTNKELGSGGAASSSFLIVPPSVVGSMEPAVTLEQMILQLDLEEEELWRVAAAEEDGWCLRRMSCVDGGGPRAPVGARRAQPVPALLPRRPRRHVSRVVQRLLRRHGPRPRAPGQRNWRRPSPPAACGYEMDLERMPATVAGESVVWWLGSWAWTPCPCRSGTAEEAVRDMRRRRQEAAEAEEDGAGCAGVPEGDALHGPAWIRRPRSGSVPQVRGGAQRRRDRQARRRWLAVRAAPLTGYRSINVRRRPCVI